MLDLVDNQSEHVFSLTARQLASVAQLVRGLHRNRNCSYLNWNFPDYLCKFEKPFANDS
jgi:hypothetical protein